MFKLEKTIAIDFDGTIVYNEYPFIGPTVPGALTTIRKLQHKGHKIILYTMRTGNTLKEAVEFLQKNGIQLFGINNNPDQKKWNDSPKIYADVYIDDLAYGCPLIRTKDKKPYVDWTGIYEQIQA